MKKMRDKKGNDMKKYFLGFMTAVLLGSLFMNVYLVKTYKANPLEVAYTNEQRDRLTALVGE